MSSACTNGCRINLESDENHNCLNVLVAKLEHVEHEIEDVKEVNKKLVKDNIRLKRQVTALNKRNQGLAVAKSGNIDATATNGQVIKKPIVDLKEKKAEREPILQQMQETLCKEMPRKSKLIMLGGPESRFEWLSEDKSSWQLGPFLPSIRRQFTKFSSAQSGNMAYITGGSGEMYGPRGGRFYRTMSRLVSWDLATGNIDELERMPAFLCNHSSAILDNMLFVFGGNQSNRANDYDLSKKVHSYKINENKWRPSVLELTEERFGMSATSVSDKQIYLIGGRNGTDHQTNEIVVFDAEKMSIEPSDMSLPTPLAFTSSIQLDDGGIVMVVGGDCRPHAQEKIYQYSSNCYLVDSRCRKVEELVGRPADCSTVTMGVVDGRVYTMSGQKNEPFGCLIYDHRAGQWIDGPVLQKRHFAGACLVRHL